MEILTAIIEILPMILVLAILIIAGVMYFKGETNKAKEWLVWAVSEAEKLYGSGTGKLKLRKAYDLFIEKFPVFSTLITFTVFEEWVDEALKAMRRMIETNGDIKEIITGETVEQ